MEAKLLMLSAEEQLTLREMGVFHSHPRARMRAQVVLRLSQGVTLQQTADEFLVHLNSVENWRQRWNKFGLVGLYEGRHSGRPRKWTEHQQAAFAELAQSEGGTVAALLRDLASRHEQEMVSEATAKRYLKNLNFSYKRYRYSLKKTLRKLIRAGKEGN